MPLYSNYTIILIEIFFQNTNVAFIKASVIDRRNEEMKTAYYNKEFCAAKSFFDCICHDLAIAKLNVHGFDRNTLKFTLRMIP